MASYLAPRVPQTSSRLCLAFLQPEKPARTAFTLARLQVGCFPCQMPESLIWGGLGLLLHRPVPPFPGTHGTGRRWGPCSRGGGQDLGGDGVFWEPFKTQGGGLGGGKVQADPQDEAKGFLPKKAERWERTIGTATCTP